MVGNWCVPVISGVTLVLCHSDLYFSFGFSNILLFAKVRMLQDRQHFLLCNVLSLRICICTLCMCW